MGDGPPVFGEPGPPAQADLTALRQRVAAAARPEVTAAPAAQIAAQPTQQNLTNLPESAAPPESWSSRTYHGILNALGGQYDTTYTPTENGVIQNQVAQTPGQQWKRIISGAIAGFAGAGAAGTTGPGGTMRGLAGGIQAGYNQRLAQNKAQQDLANTQFTQEQQAMMSKAQRSLMNIELATKTFQLGQMNVEATEAENDRYNKFMETVHQAEQSGGYVIGHFATPAEATAAFERDPSHHDSLAHGRIVSTPMITDGKINGVQAAYVPDDFMNSRADEELPVTYKFYENGKAKEVTHIIPKNQVTWGQFFDIQNRLSTTQMEDHWKDIEAGFKQKELNIRGAEAQSTISKNTVEEEAKRQETAALYGTTGPTGAGGAAPAAGGPQTYIDQIGQGRMDLKLLSRLIAKNPTILNQVVQKYPDFNQAKVDDYMKMVKDYAPGGKVGQAVNNASTAMRNLHRLMTLNTVESHIPHTPDWTEYTSQAKTIGGEIAQFYKANNIPFEEGLEDKLTSDLPGNRQAAMRAMMKGMGDKIDEYESQWNENIPSASYRPQMPRISNAAMLARAAIDPEYAKTVQHVSLSSLRGQPEFKGLTDDQITAEARSRGYMVTQ